MLQEIRCDMFHQKVIRFHNGLNVVLGDEHASNSIGKSTALMAIDFAYGGNDYVELEDVIANVGNHEVQFCFLFADGNHYFSRNTATPDMIDVCDAEYKRKETWRKEQYTAWLKEKYGCAVLNMTFRDIVGLYVRVYGKENLSEKWPLNIVPKEKSGTPIIRLLKIFGVYDTITELLHAFEAANENLKAIQSASKTNLITVKHCVREKRNRAKELETLEQEILSIKNMLSTGKVSLSQEQLSAVSGMNEELEQLNGHLLRRQGQLRRLKRSAADMQDGSVVDVEELRIYFPNVDMRKIEEVNQFHQQLSGILSTEINEQIRTTENQIKELQESISDLNKKVFEVLETQESSATMLAVNRLTDVLKEYGKLQMECVYSDEYEIREENKKQAEAEYEEALSQTLKSIEYKINQAMSALNKQIHKNPTNPPQLKLAPKTYEFKTLNDSGTGTRYKGLLLYDLSMLELTLLPILIHDTVLFKNVEDETIRKLVSFYQMFFDKQVFICLDKVSQYSEETENTLRSKTVLQLGTDGEELFGWSWSRTKP